jgi:hypothetical protein
MVTSDRMMPPDLIGTWRLVSYTMLVDGQRLDVLGPDPIGLLVYSADGFMSAVLTARGRPSAGARSLMDAESDAVLGSARQSIAYAGRFEVIGDEARHHVEASLLPDREGMTLLRRIRLEGSRLILSPTPETASVDPSAQSELVWERVG